MNMATPGEKLQNLTECCICLSAFNDPRALPCLHTFCLRCLETTSTDLKPGATMPCPLCREAFRIPAIGLSNLPKNFMVESIKDVTTMLESTRITAETSVKTEKEIREDIRTNASKMSATADEMLSQKTSLEQRKKHFLLQISEAECAIRQRNVKLKKMINTQTEALLETLQQIRQEKIAEFDIEEADIHYSYTKLKDFATYCNGLMFERSARVIFDSVNELIASAAALEKDAESFIGRPCESNKIFFQAPTDLQLDVLLNSSNHNLFGHIREETSYFENSVIIAGLNDGEGNVTKDVIQLNLHRSNEILKLQQIPTYMRSLSPAAVFGNTLYVSGIGIHSDEIWKYRDAFIWVKCASLIQGRSGHCVEFVDTILYICGGCVESDGKLLDSVEGYNANSNTTKTLGRLVYGVRSSGNCVAFKTSLYIFGGLDKGNFEQSSVQVYNTNTNACTLLLKPIPSPNGLMRAVCLPCQTSVILLGFNTCFVYNFETETWQERKQFKTDVHYFGSVLNNGRIFVIGGGTAKTDGTGKVTWTNRDDIRYVPLQSVIDNKPVNWKPYAKLERPALAETYGKIMHRM